MALESKNREVGFTVSKSKRFRIKSIVGTVWIASSFILTSCSMIPFGGGNARVSATQPPEAIYTETALSTPVDTPTITSTPTDTVIPSPTLSPTIRPTWTPFPTKTLRPTWTPSPTLSPTPTKEVGWIIKDDFSEDSPWWLKKEGGNWAVGYARGGYFMSVTDNNVEITASQAWLKIADTRVILDVYRQHGKGYWGISCRETVAGSYYTKIGRASCRERV